jgi:hypothetical protein
MHTRNHAARLAVVGVLALATSLQAQSFDVLFRVAGVKGDCQIRKPGANTFEPVMNGKAYPFGTSVRTGKNGEAFILLSPDDSLRMSSSCELSVSEPEGAPAGSNRIVRLAEGKLDVSVRDGLADQALVVETTVAACDSFVGRSTVELRKTRKPAKDKLDLRLLVHTDNGAIRISGPQFAVPKMKSGSTVRIESSTDRSMTRIINESNDYPVNIDNGTDTPVVMDTTTHSTIRICREQAPVGGKLVVSVLEIAPDGTGKGNSFAFVVGEPLLTVNGLPTPAGEHGATGDVTTATAPAATGPATNAPPKEESLFK